MMHIDEPESLKSQYRQAKDPKDWIIKNAQTLAYTPWELGTWLQEHGEEVEKVGFLAGNPAYKWRDRKKPEPTEPTELLTLTPTVLSVIRKYMSAYQDAPDTVTADRMAVALDVILALLGQ